MWETNFVPDLTAIELKSWGDRDAGGTNIMFVLADGTMHAHISEMPVGTYKKAHRHGPSFHVMCVMGQGFSLLWYENEKAFRRIDWKHGMVLVPSDGNFISISTPGRSRRVISRPPSAGCAIRPRGRSACRSSARTKATRRPCRKASRKAVIRSNTKIGSARPPHLAGGHA
jgi:hypothetical protein